MNADPKHPDVLGFVAGLHSPSEERAMAAHLDGCEGCRLDATALASMRLSLRAESGGHLSIEDLVAHDEGAVARAPESRAAIEHHLGRCRDCRSDLELLARARRVRDDAAWRPRPTAPRVPAGGTAGRRSTAWAAAAAAVLVLAGTAVVTMPWHKPESRPLAPPQRSVTFMPPKRNGLADRILFAGERVSLLVVLPYETSNGPYQARVEREDGSIVDRLVATTPIDTGTLAVSLEAPADPGGYRLVLAPEGRPQAEVLVYPFRVLAAPPAPEGG